ncbi:MAG TPA: zinc ribbon domain-containing protein [Chloroflexota bacterium]|nr:zinc ribbon domain-containing protein [Chloroflexota bacterium]
MARPARSRCPCRPVGPPRSSASRANSQNDQEHPTKTCPSCGRRYKAKGRMYRCRNPRCGFVFHRDGVGAINIRQRYTGSGLVVGVMASPTGVRYHAHLRRSAARCDRERIPVL